MVIKLVQAATRGRVLQVSSPLLRQCEDVVRILWRLRNQSGYQEFCNQDAPETALFNPGNAGVCMGYDFHVQGDQVFLIEVNTNATGLGVLEQEFGITQKIIQMFQAEFALCFPKKTLKTIAIVDESPQTQFFYEEFKFYQRLFQKAGFQALIADPSEFSLDAQGRLVMSSPPIDLVYLRSTDFYLNTPESQTLKTAYLKKTVCISPSPREFHLLANKKRLSVFCDSSKMRSWGFTSQEAILLMAAVPKTFLIRDKSIDEWQGLRKDFVFKFVDKFGARGVYLGSTLTRRKLEQLYLEDRVAQQYIPAGAVTDPQTGTLLKFDLRVMVYQEQVLAFLARVYEGRLTNFQSPLAAVIPVEGV